MADEATLIRDARREIVRVKVPNDPSKVDKNSQVWLASDFDVAGDGATDDTTALSSLLSSAVTFGAKVLLAPASVVQLDTVNIPSGTRLDLNGATLRKTTATGQPMLILSGKSNVVIENGVIDGDKANFATATEHRHGVKITAASANITLRNLRSINNKGDGVYVGGGDGSAASSDIRLDNVTCDGNHRNGLSVTAVSGLTATACRFVNSAGTAPQNGVDVEVNTDTDVLEAVTFIGCIAEGNTMDGFEVLCFPTATVRQGDVSFIGCSSLDNGRHGYLLYDVSGVKVIAGQSSGNTQHGFELTGTASNEDVLISGVTVSGNARYGIRAIVSFNDLRIQDCTVKDNGSATPGFYPGIEIAPTVASTNVHVYGCRSTGASQPYGYRDNANTSKVSLISNRLTGTTSAMSLGNDVATRVLIDESGTTTVPAINIFRAAGSSVVNVYRTGDSAPRISLTTDSRVRFGSGTAIDLAVFRSAAGVLGIDGPATTGTTAPAAGGAGALPATPTGYLTVNINGTNRQIAYY